MRRTCRRKPVWSSSLLAGRRSGPGWLEGFPNPAGRKSKQNWKIIQAKPEGNPSVLLPRIERFQRVRRTPSQKFLLAVSSTTTRANPCRRMYNLGAKLDALRRFYSVERVASSGSYPSPLLSPQPIAPGAVLRRTAHRASATKITIAWSSELPKQLLRKIGYRNCDGQGPRSPLGFADGTEFRPEPPASDKNRLPGSRRLTPDAPRTAVRDGKLSLAPFAAPGAAPSWKHGRSGIFRRASPARVPVLNCGFGRIAGARR